MFIATHPQTNGEYQDAAHESGVRSQGAALADLFMKYVEQSASSLKQCLKDLVQLSNDGREEFRKQIDSIRKERNKFVKDSKGTDQHDRLKKINQSATVRLSEAVSFSKALDMGFVPDFDQSYHTIVSDARMMLDSGAAKRGRKAKTDLEKAMEFLAKLQLSDDDRGQLLEFVASGCDDTEPALM